MGVSGSGKTTVAALLASTLHWPFVEGDDLHTPDNVAKMRAGTPLNDADRAPWLARLAAAIDRLRQAGQGGVVTCSALHRAYRDVLIGPRPDVALVYLKGEHNILAQRMRARAHHFMPVTLLDSQLATLEAPGAEEHPIVLPITAPPSVTVQAIIAALRQRD